MATHVPSHPDAVALVLHGGARRQDRSAVSPAQLSVLRMVPVARRIARAGRGRLGVFRLLNSSRGWEAEHTPAQDAEWALAEIRKRLGELPVSLVGHSLGGRAALLAGAGPGVRSVVAMAPYVYPYDGATKLAGRRVLVVHGTEDRVASPANAAAVARALSRSTDVGFISITGGDHAMLRHGRRFDGYAAEFVRATLLGDRVDGPVGQVLNGAQHVEV